ncbi:hypothetical protein [Gluconacetobacter sacchari]|uniref:Uncharacterized protein n=2 Tax=Gluconacetobacter sacchari TaxID=92759 RepID=A0A7W4IEC3_9PROT|nr:hypothetical protein [Gluconacetobacter sacchari]MBB2161313.1 hypothetical protein [Gluconacetobacter sacchari]
MAWKQEIISLPSSYKGGTIRHPLLTNDDGISILFDKSIWGGFNVFKYKTSKFSIDLSILKKKIKMNNIDCISLDLFLLSDLANFIRKNIGKPNPYTISPDEVDQIKRNLAEALPQWKNLFHPDDGPLAGIKLSTERLNWYLAEERASDPRQSAYWLNSTELGFNIEKAITENIADDAPFRISEENQLWDAAAKRFAEQASGDVNMIL